MKTLLTAIALLVSVLSFSQDMETMTTDSLSSKKSKGASKYEFNFIEGSMMYGKTTTNTMDQYHGVLSITYVEKDNIYVYELDKGYMLHVNKDENYVILLTPWGSQYKYY